MFEKTVFIQKKFRELFHCSTFCGIITWEQRELGEVVDVRSGKDYKHLSEGDIPVFGTGGYMLSVNEALSYTEDAIGIGRKGTIDKPYILKAPFWTVDTLFYAVPRTNVDLNFAFDLFQNIDWKKKDESTGVPSLSKTAINEIDVMCPSYDEQQVLGNYFANLDRLITLHQRQQNFKTDKSTVLKSTENANAWEQRELGEMSSSFEYGLNAAAKAFDGKNKYIRITDIDDETRIFSKTDLSSPDTDLSNAENYRLSDGDIVFARTGASVGKSYIYSRSDGLVYFAGFLIRAKIKPEYSAEFVFQNTLTKNYEKFIQITSQRSGQPGVNAQEYSEYKIYTPLYEEQEKIGQFFHNLDRLITLHQRK